MKKVIFIFTNPEKWGSINTKGAFLHEEIGLINKHYLLKYKDGTLSNELCSEKENQNDTIFFVLDNEMGRIKYEEMIKVLSDTSSIYTLLHVSARDCINKQIDPDCKLPKDSHLSGSKYEKIKKILKDNSIEESKKPKTIFDEIFDPKLEADKSKCEVVMKFLHGCYEEISDKDRIDRWEAFKEKAKEVGIAKELGITENENLPLEGEYMSSDYIKSLKKLSIRLLKE